MDLAFHKLELSVKGKNSISSLVAAYMFIGAWLPVEAENINQPAASGQDPNVVACATCGCSECCPIAMIETTDKNKNGSALTDSIWGNIILKMAYGRDEQLRKLAKKLNITNATSDTAIAAFAGGTLGQGIISMKTLNQPAGLEDSYIPGIIGLSLSTGVNIGFTARLLLDSKFQKQYRARQLFIRQQVESILEQLENAGEKSTGAQSELAELIGDRGAEDCMQLWHSSHQQLAGKPSNISMLNTDKH
jgi:hypothetical protein